MRVTNVPDIYGGMAIPDIQRDPYPLIGQSVEFRLPNSRERTSGLVVARNPNHLDGPRWTVAVVYVLQRDDLGSNHVGIAYDVAWLTGETGGEPE